MIKNLVFSGGGMKGVAYVGCLKALEKFSVISGLENIAGSSIGALIATLIALKYNYLELKDLIMSLNYDEIQDIQISKILTGFGLDSGNNIERLVRELVKYKTGKYNYTLGELLENYGINLVIVATCLEDEEAIYFSGKTHPTVPIFKAVRMSISIPIFFTAQSYEGKTYVDGGLLDNFPIALFEPEHTLGIQLISAKSGGDVNSIDQFVHKIWSCVYNRMKKLSLNVIIKKYKVLVLDTQNVHTFNFNISIEEKKLLINEGYTQTYRYLKNVMKFNIHKKASNMQTLIQKVLAKPETTTDKVESTNHS